MISGLAPGRLDWTEIVGKSICGNGETGNNVKATAPASAIATVNKVVATGRRMNGDERLMMSPIGPPQLILVDDEGLKVGPQSRRRTGRSRVWCRASITD